MFLLWVFSLPFSCYFSQTIISSPRLSCAGFSIAQFSQPIDLSTPLPAIGLSIFACDPFNEIFRKIRSVLCISSGWTIKKTILSHITTMSPDTLMYVCIIRVSCLQMIYSASKFLLKNLKSPNLCGLFCSSTTRALNLQRTAGKQGLEYSGVHCGRCASISVDTVHFSMKFIVKVEASSLLDGYFPIYLDWRCVGFSNVGQNSCHLLELHPGFSHGKKVLISQFRFSLLLCGIRVTESCFLWTKEGTVWLVMNLVPLSVWKKLPASACFFVLFRLACNSDMNILPLKFLGLLDELEYETTVVLFAKFLVLPPLNHVIRSIL